MTVGERWKTNRKRIATAALLITAAGMVPRAGLAEGQEATDGRPALAYACRFPSGTQEISVRVTSAFPANATVGEALQPGRVTATFTVPGGALGDLTGLGAVVVSGAAKLTTTVAQGGTPTGAALLGLPVPLTPVSGEGDLVLNTMGGLSPVTPDAAGMVTFTAGDLTLALRPRKADGSATDPATMSLACTLLPGQDTTLASVWVSDRDAPSPVPSPAAPKDQNGGKLTITTTAENRPPEEWCPPKPTEGLNPKWPLPIPPPDSWIIELPPEWTMLGCAYAKGRSNVKKLNGAAPVGRDVATFAVGSRIVANYDPSVNYFESDSFGEIQYQPNEATFLTFGFMPTTAKMQLTQVGTMNNIAVGPATYYEGYPYAPLVSTVYTDVSLRIYDVKVNGVPLDVGPRCQTIKPVELILVGKNDWDPSNDDVDPPYTIQNGGPLTGYMEIPSFSGCGVDEDLDPMFTASVSGPGNYVRIIQGPLCFSEMWWDPIASGCGPDGPKPVPEGPDVGTAEGMSTPGHDDTARRRTVP